MTAGDFTGFIVALTFLYEPIKRLTNIHNIFQQGIGAALKVFSYLDDTQHVVDSPDARRLPRFEKSIKFSGVSFQYPTAPDRLVLDRINLEVARQVRFPPGHRQIERGRILGAIGSRLCAGFR